MTSSASSSDCRTLRNLPSVDTKSSFPYWATTYQTIKVRTTTAIVEYRIMLSFFIVVFPHRRIQESDT